MEKGGSIIQYDWCRYKKRRETRREARTGKTPNVMTEVETEVMQLQDKER